MSAEATSKPVPPVALKTNGRPRIVILGAGFAGLNCAKKLRHAAVDITVVDRNNCNVFQPLLYQVALALTDRSAYSFCFEGCLKHDRPDG